MFKAKSVLLRAGGFLASIALILGVASSQALCTSWFHQPKMPKAMDKFKKL